ncbi:MAG: hypothetical protein DRR42_22300 [Gammaproteobacteria bacterium]|nr:MAG: hypothetical protein DRR42_22300 [Gammaproteobacteria bacterium]
MVHLCCVVYSLNRVSIISGQDQDESLGLIHSLTTTPANMHDITQADQLLHGNEKRVWGDGGYRGIEKREEHTGRDVDWLIALRPGVRSKLAKSDPLAAVEKSKAGKQSNQGVLRPKIRKTGTVWKFRSISHLFQSCLSLLWCRVDHCSRMLRVVNVRALCQ